MAFAKKIGQIGIAALAVLSLFATSVSACNCSHHVEQVQTEVPSCHSHSHQANSGAKGSSSRSLDAPCECLLAKPAPAIIAKSEKKKLQLQKAVTDPLAASVGFEQPHLSAVASATVTPNDPLTYLSRHLGLLPSRAPPRL